MACTQWHSIVAERCELGLCALVLRLMNKGKIVLLIKHNDNLIASAPAVVSNQRTLQHAMANMNTVQLSEVDEMNKDVL